MSEMQPEAGVGNSFGLFQFNLRRRLQEGPELSAGISVEVQHWARQHASLNHNLWQVYTACPFLSFLYWQSVMYLVILVYFTFVSVCDNVS